MILQALDGYYHRLAGRDGAAVPLFGYSDQSISYAVVLSSDGTALDIVPLGSQGKRRFEPTRMPVPGPIIRTSGIAANFLWDKTSYVLGVKRDSKDKTKIVETPRERAAFRKLHEELLTRTDDEGLRAVLAFLASWTPALFKQTSNGPDVLDANLVFRLDGELDFIHNQPAARDIWARKLADNKGADGLCLVSGKTAPLARLHPSIKGVRDAQSSGAAIVSFNLDAFTSFGKEQGLNAPVSEQAAFAYTTALNHLLRADERNRQRLQIADATTVFWAEARTPEEESAAEAAEALFMWMLAPPSEETLDEKADARVRSALEKVAAGRPLKEINFKLDEGTRCFVLGLAPNAARLSVRFWHVDTLGTLARRFHQHWQDLLIEPKPWKTAPEPWRLVRETAAQRKAENIPPNLAGEVMRAILTGGRYPETLFASVVMRCRADRELNGMRAAILKACLVRADRAAGRKESVSVGLDLEETNTGYRLGRLFAVFELAQSAALESVKGTIRKRYFAAASSRPFTVFQSLAKLKNHHIDLLLSGKSADWARKNPKGIALTIEKDIGQIMSGLPTLFPKTLNLEDQGRFVIGYYHQRYTKRSDTPVPELADPSTIETLDDEA